MDDIRDTIIQLSIRANNGDKQANRDLDTLLANTINVSRLDLFIKRISNKDCIKTLRRLVKGVVIDEHELSLAISSLLTNSLLELKYDPSLYVDLKIREQVTILNEFIKGEIDVWDAIDFYKDFI